MSTDGATTAFDRETRLRFMRIDDETRTLLREFWKTLEPALKGIIDGFYEHVTREPTLARLLGNEIPRMKAAQAKQASMRSA